MSAVVTPGPFRLPVLSNLQQLRAKPVPVPSIPPDEALIRENPTPFRHQDYVQVKARTRSVEHIQQWLRTNFHRMELPAAYLGDEPNTYQKDWSQHDFRTLLIGAMSYSASEGNLAIPLIYGQLNELRPQYITERFFFWNSRNEYQLFKQDTIPPFGLETKHPAHQFDVLAFSVSYIMPFIHIPLMLAQAGLPIYANERSDVDPYVVVGGCMSPVAETMAGGNGGVADIIFVGESEDGLCELLDLLRAGRQAGKARADILFEATTQIPGVYVPKFYDVLYHPENRRIIKRVPLRAGVPERVRKAYVRDLDKGYRFTNPVISYKGGMAMGQYEVARGCSSACNFCQEAHTYRPYRERSVEVIVQDMKKMLVNSGSLNVLPAAFTASDHRQINLMTKRLLEEVSEDVSIVSQRADAFGIDETFAKLTSMGGSHTVSIGMEGVSQRIRDALNKAVSERDLLASIEYAIKNGYTSVKLFMITNIPGTVTDDYEELVIFLQRVRDIRNNYNSKCEVKLSFTPLFISAHTPYQWNAATVDERTLTPWIRKIKALGFGFRLGSGARRDESYASQLLHLGDRRLTKVIVKAALQDEFMHYGATPKGTIDKWNAYMEEDNVSFQWYFQQKGFDWNFSWDHFDLLTSKESLWQQYQRSLQAVGQVAPCIEECYVCKACDSQVWEMRKDWAKDRVEDGKVDASKVVPIRQSGDAQRVRIKLEMDPLHRYIERDHWKYQVRRALYLENIPFDKKSIKFGSDNIKMFNWISGTDYVDVKLIRHVFDKMPVVQALQKHLRGAKPIDARIYNNMKQMCSIRDTCLYELPCSTNNRNELQAELDRFLAYEPITEEVPNDAPGRDGKVPRELKSLFMKKYPQAIRIKRMGFRGVERVIVDLRTAVDDAWLVSRPEGLILQLKMRGDVTPYDAYAGIFHTKWKAGLGFPAARLDFLIEQDRDQDDFTVNRCDECEQLIEQDLFSVPMHDTFCVKHAALLT
jgi:radical SAM superfamily enzyme YgiQ (UPF0313 family)